MSTLIVFASKHGCTEKCANLLSKELKDKVDIVNLKTSKDVSISQYDKVIIGGSIYIGKIQKEVTAFCSKNLENLKGKKIGLFICAGMKEEDEINKKISEVFPSELLEVAVVKKHLGGEYYFDKMNFFERFIVKKIAKVSSSQSDILKDNISSFAKAMNSI